MGGGHLIFSTNFEATYTVPVAGGAVTIVGDSSSAICEGGYNPLVDFSEADISGDTVVMIASNTRGERAIYTAPRSGFVGVVDESCVPAPTLRATNAALIASANTPVPGDAQGRNFYIGHDGFDIPLIDGNVVIFRGAALNPSTQAVDLVGIYSAISGTLTKLVDTNTPVPGGTGNFQGTGNSLRYYTLNNGTVVFFGQDTAGKDGLYLISATGGPITKIIAVGDSLGEGRTVQGVNGAVQPPIQTDSLSGNQLAFRVDFYDSTRRTTGTGIYVATISDSPPASPAFTLTVPKEIGLIHLPLKVRAVNDKVLEIKTISNLYDALGGVANVNFIITRDTSKGVWRSYLGNVSRGTPADRTITDDMGMITVMRHPVTLHLTGDALGTNGVSQIHLSQGTNLVGVPLNDERLTRVSDLLGLEGIKNNAIAIIVLDNGTFKVVARPGDDGDIAITGNQSFIITAKTSGVAEITGVAWADVSSSAAPPMMVVGHQVNESTPVLAVNGGVVNEDTGAILNLLKDGVRVTVKNLSTGTALSTLAGGATPQDGYSVTFVDALSSRAARVNDVLEITAETPSPLISVQPLRHIVSVDDVNASLIRLPNLIVSEIPKETKLLPNYPNPFNPETWIPYRLAEDALVTLTIYDMAGKMVRTIPIGQKHAAVYESRDKAIYWDGRNDSGERVASGVYFYSLAANAFVATRKMLILK
ncbi:T9SS type A sorting domain-containing protein [Candidatus Poribacteria bacterium]|nr:T9SS type A sorting domain-containing protein [Candidatus Poribacteria bacterium]